MFNTFMHLYKFFTSAQVTNPAAEALHLLDVLSNGAIRKIDVSLPADLDLEHIARQRRLGVPMGYVLGQMVFMGLTFVCTSSTLIPRQETELLAGVSLDIIRMRQSSAMTALTVADIGTGCGNLALSLAAYTQNVHILASDISEEAIEVARLNSKRLDLEDRITFFHGDMMMPLLAAGYRQLDMVICNPPYIPSNSLDKLHPEIIDHEPKIALDAGPYGIDMYRKLINDAQDILRPGGVLVVEIGEGQVQLVERLLHRSQRYEDIKHHYKDGHVRTLSAQKKLLESL